MNSPKKLWYVQADLKIALYTIRGSMVYTV